MGAGAALPFGCGGEKPAANGRPNIIVMMADDMGYSDIGCYGGEVDTPNLNRLASNGVRFTNFYNTARCCPTRASLLTGLYQHQAGVGHMMGDYGIPGYRGDLNTGCVTMAEALKPAGYHTLMSGKWHVTPHDSGSKHNWPRQRGFDRFFGTILGAGSFYDPVTLTRENEPIRPESGDFYYTNAISDQAVGYIDEYASQPDPFFMYVAYTSPHWPLHALDKDIAKYKGRYAMGWDELRQQRYKRMIEMGIVDERWQLTPRDEDVPAWKDAPNKEWEQRRMEVFAAQIDCMDQGIGRIVSKLEEQGILDNTLILFLADNGGCAEELSKSWKGDFIPAKTLDGRPVELGNEPEFMPGPEETYQSYGLPWANASNTPFRLYKHWVHEGGISTPLIAHWPKKIGKTNTLNPEPGHLIDIMATCVDVAGTEYPATYNGNAITPLEGKSLAPVLETGSRAPHEAIFWEHEGNRAIRKGKWKLVSRWNREDGGQWELYDLEADRTEMNNLAAGDPDRVNTMKADWEAWAKRANVAPWKSWEAEA